MSIKKDNGEGRPSQPAVSALPPDANTIPASRALARQAADTDRKRCPVPASSSGASALASRVPLHNTPNRNRRARTTFRLMPSSRAVWSWFPFECS
jgi:hypothetical protein